MTLLGTVSIRMWFLLFAIALGFCLFTGNQIRQVSRSPLPGVLPVIPLKFELVWTQTKALSLIKTWGTDAAGRLRLGLYWDFAFIPAYVLLLILLTSRVACSLGPPAWSRLGGRLGYGVLAAGAFDVVENIALLQVLGPQPALFWAPLAGLVSSLKWAIVIVAGAYVIIGGLRSLWRLRSNLVAERQPPKT